MLSNFYKLNYRANKSLLYNLIYKKNNRQNYSVNKFEFLKKLYEKKNDGKNFLENFIYSKLGFFGYSYVFKRVPLGFGLKRNSLYGFKLRKYKKFMIKFKDSKTYKIQKALQILRKKSHNVFQLYFGDANLL